MGKEKLNLDIDITVGDYDKVISEIERQKSISETKGKVKLQQKIQKLRKSLTKELDVISNVIERLREIEDM